MVKGPYKMIMHADCQIHYYNFGYIAALKISKSEPMNVFIGLGKYIFALPMAVFGFLHFLRADTMLGIAPFGGVVAVYLIGSCLILFALSVFLGKYDKLAALLFAFLLVIVIITIHLSALGSGETGDLLKDLSITGGALMYAGAYAKDNRVIG